MTQFDIVGLEKKFGEHKVLHGIDLEVNDGEFLVLVGPSGSGKSTLLRIIAGLEDASSGVIAHDGVPKTNLPPQELNLAMVFQDYALYPHMTVRQNMSFGLKIRGTPKKEIEARVNEAAAILGLSEYLGRRPSKLSGGQRQRVAMGRAMVRQPAAFLFDEPLSNLDAKLRVEMRSEIVAMHQRVGATTIYVTHDQVEAMTMGDRIVLLRDGCIEQIGSPMDLYLKPKNVFVARFIGMPPMNILSFGDIAGESKEIAALAERAGAEFIGLRPEHLRQDSGDGIKLTVQDVRSHPVGATTQLTARVGSSQIEAALHGSSPWRQGDTGVLSIAAEDVYLFDKQQQAIDIDRTHHC